jgi:hypothetical protein
VRGASQRALVGAARNRRVGRIPSGGSARDEVERLTAAERAAVKGGSARAGRVPDQEPFADKQWDMRMIISVHGRHDPRHGGLTMSPRAVERVMTRTARQTPCPSPPNFAYPDDRDPSFDGVCEGTLARNGIYGRGIVNALTAVLH